MERQLPKNVRQIGNVSDNPKIYVEDYVDTYLNQLREKAREQPVGVILTGELLKLEDENAVFVSGAVQMKEVKTNGNDIEITDEIMKEAKEEAARFFPECRIVGWGIIEDGSPMSRNREIKRIQEKEFAEEWNLFLWKNAREQEEVFYAYKFGEIMQMGGHYIYYEKNPLMQVVNIVMAAMAPLMNLMCAAGIIKGILSIAVLCGLPSDSGYYQLFNAIGDAIFYFMPMLLGMNLAKKFAIDPVFGFLVGAVMLYPTIQGVDLNLFGMTVNATYTSTFLPVVFTMAIAIPLYKWLEKRVSKLVKSFMVPAIALAVAVPLGFSLVGPAANMVGNALNVVLTVIFDTVPLVAFIIFGGLYQVFVLFGIHGAICMVPFMELLQGHPVRMLVCTLIPCFAQTGVVLAVCLKTKDKKLKDIALPAFFSGIFGVTEPAIYGVTLPRIKMFVIACIGAAAGSAVGAITGLTLYSYAGMGVIGLLGMINPNGATNFVGIILMVAVAFGFSFVMAWFTYKDEDGTSENILTEQGEKNQKKSAPRTEKSAMALQKVEIAAPLSGTVKPLGECSDEAFSTEVLGKGVVILPENGIVMAPFDGVVENLFSTRHAIALTDKTGCNVLIHIGMNTVRLDGEGFKAFVKQGDTVKKGDKLLEVDINSIHEKGYSLETPVLVTNADDYADVIEMASGSVKAGAPLLTALK